MRKGPYSSPLSRDTMLCVHSLDNEDILNNGHKFTICVYGTTCEKLILYLLYQSDSYISR